ncbi:hypothetical protein ZIOFF_000251 [Zingiber officinale]|uniref:Uncharacterized protein n=1 Tax=Zingiber officinale TaxID=94328 RepID=A0A8J5HTG5_ZINOF|nr:hypothetical protein ZIOFF_000251 [Zingiber officinale]
MAELLGAAQVKENRVFKCAFAVFGIMSSLLIYGILQEKIMRIPYGINKEYFRYSLFLVFCNRIMTSAVSAGVLLASKKSLDPVAPMYKYCAVSISNILTTTCQYEALKYVSFPVQTLAKCAKMIPVMVWGTLIMQKKYNGKDYLFALLVTIGCAVFILYPIATFCNSIRHLSVASYKFFLWASTDITPYNTGRESTIWGISLMLGYLGFDGFTSTFQDKLFRGYDMEIHNQIFYTTVCSCLLSLTDAKAETHSTGSSSFSNKFHVQAPRLLLRCSTSIHCKHILPKFPSPSLSALMVAWTLVSTAPPRSCVFRYDALDLNAKVSDRYSRCFFFWHTKCSQVATVSQFFISYTIRNFGALTFATIMTTRQLVSILLSCIWFAHPLSWEQLIGAGIVFGSIYTKSFLRSQTQRPQHTSSSSSNA